MIFGNPRQEEAPMIERSPEEKPMPTIWRVPDELWEKIEPILAEHDPPKRTGRPRADRRAILDAIIFRLRTGCQWNRLPKEFPDDSTVHRAFQRWVELGVLDRIWAALVEESEELGGVNWEWQAVDGAMGKARFGGTSSALTPRIELRRG
jgi:putative transposase